MRAQIDVTCEKRDQDNGFVMDMDPDSGLYFVLELDSGFYNSENTEI